MNPILRRKMIGQYGLKADANNPHYAHNMKVFIEESKKHFKEPAAGLEKPVAVETAVPRPGKPGVVENLAASLACADEVFMRCAPAAMHGTGRTVAAEVIQRDKADLVAVLRELGEALESNAELNTYTGEFCTLVNPDWFGRLRRALERHSGVRVMDRMQLPGVGKESAT